MKSYAADLNYEIWRMGGNPDSVHPDTAHAYRADGYSAEDAAHAICRRAHYRSEAMRREREAEEAAYYQRAQDEDEESAYYESLERQAILDTAQDSTRIAELVLSNG